MMHEQNRDLRRPISYCCEQMEHELSKTDIIDYIWHTRDYIIRSSRVPQVRTHVNFCPWCGKDVERYSVHDEYLEAYERARQADPTLPEIYAYSDLEGFRERFLRDWERGNPIGNS